MIRFTSVLHEGEPGEPTLTIPLDHEHRRRSRLRLMLSGGTDVGINLPRGRVLRDGDRLRSEDGQMVARVRADSENLSVASTGDVHLLARAAYHLGNRHVPLQVEPDCLLYPHDHVLDGLCRELGLVVRTERRPFEPEVGGYAGGHADSHGPSDAHGHGHEH